MRLEVSEDFECSCSGLSFESQLARMVAVSYDDKGIRSLESYATEIFSCYSWSVPRRRHRAYKHLLPVIEMSYVFGDVLARGLLLSPA